MLALLYTDKLSATKLIPFFLVSPIPLSQNTKLRLHYSQVSSLQILVCEYYSPITKQLLALYTFQILLVLVAQWLMKQLLPFFFCSPIPLSPNTKQILHWSQVSNFHDSPSIIHQCIAAQLHTIDTCA